MMPWTRAISDRMNSLLFACRATTGCGASA